MSRVTKFRAWDLKKAMMLSSDDLFHPITYEDYSFLDSILREDDDPKLTWLDEPFEPYEGASNYVLMQYTGKQDSKGTDIWEDDIVKIV